MFYNDRGLIKLNLLCCIHLHFFFSENICIYYVGLLQFNIKPKTLQCIHILSYFFTRIGILEVLYCVLIESPEVLNIIQENHIKSIISLLDKHGRNHKVRNAATMFSEHTAKTWSM